jgi:hypothetical protein
MPAQSKQQMSELTSAQQQKASFNTSIVEATQVSLAVKDQSLALLLNTAIDKINEALAPVLGDDAIQKAADTGLDVSPKRLLSESLIYRLVFIAPSKNKTRERMNPFHWGILSIPSVAGLIKALCKREIYSKSFRR